MVLSITAAKNLHLSFILDLSGMMNVLILQCVFFRICIHDK